MATLRIRAINEKVKAGLCVQAARRAGPRSGVPSASWSSRCWVLRTTSHSRSAYGADSRRSRIPAIALHHRVRLATRYSKDFAYLPGLTD